MVKFGVENVFLWWWFRVRSELRSLELCAEEFVVGWWSARVLEGPEGSHLCCSEVGVVSPMRFSPVLRQPSLQCCWNTSSPGPRERLTVLLIYRFGVWL